MRLIDADALLKKWQDVLDENADEKGTVAYITFELFIDRLKEEPTIDAVPVVRCEDCKHMTRQIGLGTRYCKVWSNFNGMGDEGFCNYGERKTDGK